MRPQDPGQAATRPLADATVQIELPPDLFAMFELQPAMSRAERLTLVLTDQ